MKSLHTIKRLTLKSLLAMGLGTTILASGTGCDAGSETGGPMSSAIARLVPPSPWPFYERFPYIPLAGIDTSEVKVDNTRRTIQLSAISNQ